MLPSVLDRHCKSSKRCCVSFNVLRVLISIFEYTFMLLINLSPLHSISQSSLKIVSAGRIFPSIPQVGIPLFSLYLTVVRVSNLLSYQDLIAKTNKFCRQLSPLIYLEDLPPNLRHWHFSDFGHMIYTAYEAFSNQKTDFITELCVPNIKEENVLFSVATNTPF